MEKNNIETRVQTYLTANEAMEKALKLPPTKALYKTFWYENELCIFFAESNVGKSLYAMQMAEDIAQERKVMYLDYELSLSQFRSRYTNDKTGVPYKFSDNLYRPSLRIEQVCTDNEVEAYLFQKIEEGVKMGVKTYIVDNITYLCGKLDQGMEATRIMKRLSAMKHTYGLSLLVIAHTKKRNSKKEIVADDLAGSKRLMNFCDSSFAMGRSQMDEKTIYLKQIKVRQGENQHGRDNVILYRIVKEDNFPQFVEEGCSAEEKLLKPSKSEDKNILKAKVRIFHEEGLSNRAIAKELGVAEGTVRNWLKELKEVANVSTESSPIIQEESEAEYVEYEEVA